MGEAVLRQLVAVERVERTRQLCQHLAEQVAGLRRRRCGGVLDQEFAKVLAKGLSGRAVPTEGLDSFVQGRQRSVGFLVAFLGGGCLFGQAFLLCQGGLLFGRQLALRRLLCLAAVVRAAARPEDNDEHGRGGGGAAAGEPLPWNRTRRRLVGTRRGRAVGDHRVACE